MANKEQLAILKQGVAVWNKWREENPDAKIDLRGVKLDRIDLSGANFRNADIRDASFRFASIEEADFNGAILGQDYQYGYGTDFNYANLFGSIFDNIILTQSVTFFDAIVSYTSWRNIRVANVRGIIEYINIDSIRKFNKLASNVFKDTILADNDVFMLLILGRCHSLSLKGKNLKSACLVNFDLRGVDLRETNLLQAYLRGADITGAKLYGSARENWIIDGIRCDYVYWDEAGEQRTPPDRDFRPGEFEELYKQLPTFEYIFEQGFTPLDPLIMDRVVQAINKQHKEFSLELVNFDKRGQPHATFTVCHLEHVEKAKQQIAAGYEKNRIAPEPAAQLMEDFMALFKKSLENQSKLIDKIPSSRGLAMGDTYNIHGGQIGAVGQSASATGNTFQQITADLSRLHEEMQRSAKTSEQRAATEDVAKAAQAASEQNEPALRQHLKNAGKFALDCAKTIGTDVAAECLKKAMGM
jgi:uncharacterized protein YjbI with pentapeptide repeats